MPPAQSSEAKRQCPTCGVWFYDELTSGLCPRCLLANAIGTEIDTSGDAAGIETIDTGTTKGPSDQGIKLSNGPKSFGEYDLLSEIARGGMGVVYRARHRKLGREVALKVILSGQFASTNDVRRFQMEAEAAAALDHPGVVPIYEIGEHDGQHFFTMKLIEGGSLAESMPRLAQDARQMVGVLAAVADAINYAHQHGILHRDIKPANILLDQKGNPLVTDLGLAKRTGSDSDITGTGAIVGTPAYMSPEQASASKEVTTAADIYAIGAILYEGMTGHPPHQADSAIATLVEAAKGDVRPPSELNRKADRILERICMKCLSPDPSERYASAGLLSADLNCWLRGERVSVRSKSFVSSISDLVASQMRSVIGAMLIGTVGGVLSGAPVYSGMTSHWLGSEDSVYSITQLSQEMPSNFHDAWWLHPPVWISETAFFFALPCCFLLGWVIRSTVRPKDTQGALAFGLVAGLLMTIVQFGLYGIVASWQTYGVANSAKVQQLAEASMLDGEQRTQAINKLFETYPDLKQQDAQRRAELLGKAVSADIMLVTPKVHTGCFLVCLVMSTICCVLGTVHAQRLFDQGFRWPTRATRYLESMIVLFGVLALTVGFIFFTFGMITDKDGPVSLPPVVVIALVLTLLATVPGLLLKRWFIRWGTYGLCVTIYLLS